jgi:hypothetical protein
VYESLRRLAEACITADENHFNAMCTFMFVCLFPYEINKLYFIQFLPCTACVFNISKAGTTEWRLHTGTDSKTVNGAAAIITCSS